MKINTKCVQAGYEPKNGEPRVLPLYQSTTYKYDTCEAMGELFDLTAGGYMYTRLGNPTTGFVEEKIASLEGGVGALCTSSGQAATLISIMNITSCGQNILASSAIYGGSVNLLSVTLKRFGVEVRYFEPYSSSEEVTALIDENTRLIFGETLSNPSLDILDIERFAEIAHSHNIPLFVDNTFPTPINCRPFDFGADIVTHSTSKYMDGHAGTLGGVIVDGGKFNWSNGKYPELSTPDDSYHGTIYTESFGESAFIVKARTQLMRDLGSTPSPFNAYLLNLGLETLHLRMERHCQNAQALAEYLEHNDKISWVNYPSLKSSKQYELCEKYMPKGSCGVISFGVKGGRKASVKFLDSLTLAKIVTHVADARTCALHPASTTHRQLTAKQLEDGGIPEDLIRFSVGIEDIQDIVADVEAALKHI